jgi:hypothetical protein
MPDLQILRVVLSERGTGQPVGGGTLRVNEGAGEWPLPCEIPLVPGNHRIEARHPSRVICGENPRVVNVVISTDPGGQPQVEVVEVEPV